MLNVRLKLIKKKLSEMNFGQLFWLNNGFKKFNRKQLFSIEY
jgi:hypothetical protein